MHSTSYLLRNISNELLLNDQRFSDSYKLIKSNIYAQKFPEFIQSREEYRTLIGKGLGNILIGWDFTSGKLKANYAIKFYNKNKNLIDDYFNNKNLAFDTAEEKTNEYITRKSSDIFFKNEKLIDHIDNIYSNLRNKLELNLTSIMKEFSKNNEDNAVISISMVMINKHLSKKWGKSELFHLHGEEHKFGKDYIDTFGNQNSKNKYLEADKFLNLTINTSGSFTHQLTNIGSYKDIQKRILYLNDKNWFSPQELKDKFKSIIKKCFNNDFQENSIVQILNSDIKLLFNIEVQRNFSAFFTNAMFFDLISIGKYKIEDMGGVENKGNDGRVVVDVHNKMPMATINAVPMSIRIYKEFDIKNNYVTNFNNYDFRDHYNNSAKPEKLSALDHNLLFDWLLHYKFEIDTVINIANPINNLLHAPLPQKYEYNIMFVEDNLPNVVREIVIENIPYKIKISIGLHDNNDVISYNNISIKSFGIMVFEEFKQDWCQMPIEDNKIFNFNNNIQGFTFEDNVITGDIKHIDTEA